MGLRSWIMAAATRIGPCIALALCAGLTVISPGAASGTNARQDGVALVRAGDLRAGIAALERAVTAAPSAAGTRLDLGLAYFLDRDDRRAQYHLEAAMAGALSPRDTQIARTALERIAARRVWQGSVRLAFVPQTNAGRRSSEQEVIIAGLPFRLDQTAEPGTGLAFGAQISVAPILRPGLRGRIVLSLDGSVYQNRELNDYTLRGEAGLEHDTGILRWGGGVQAAQRWLGDRSYSWEGGVLAMVSALPDARRRHDLRVDLVHRKVPVLPARDAWIGRLALGTAHAISPQLILNGRLHAARTDARRDFASSWTWGGGAGAVRLFDGGYRAGIDLRWSRERRDGPAPVFGLTRVETESALRVHLLNRSLQWRGIAPVVALEVERRRSNIAIFDYTNQSVSLGLSRTF